MVRFYCDRCSSEVEGPDDLIEVAVEGRERPSLSAWNWKAEMCRPCYETLKEAMTSLLGSSDDGKRKPVRRASS